jgi:hypothetical protein
MKRFRLVKDIPGLKAGAIFELVNNCYCNDKTRKSFDPHYDFEIKVVEGSPNWFVKIS